MITQHNSILLVLFCLSASRILAQVNNRPIIGVLAQKLPESPALPVAGDSYISSSYVKYLESAGARVVPIKTNLDQTEVLKTLSSINGVLFPGGDADVANSAYQRNAQYAFEYALSEAENGRRFPLWGTCLGMQQLSALAAGTDSILTRSNGTWNEAMPLIPTTEISRMFTEMPTKINEIVTSKSVTYNAHYNCVSTDSYHQNKALNNFFKIATVNKDSDGKIYLSTIEARDYPIFAVQWHPEMNVYEFASNEGLGPNINHSQDAILVSQYFANFFVSEARKNFNEFDNVTTEQKHLIYNYQPIYAVPYGWFGEQIYVF